MATETVPGGPKHTPKAAEIEGQYWYSRIESDDISGMVVQ